MRLKIDNLDRILLVGGGALLRQITLWARSEGAPISVVTSPRHAEEKLKDETLTDFFTTHKVPFLVTDKIATEEVKKFIGDTKDTFCLSTGAAWIFRKPVIDDFFNGRLFNLHGTRLPQNRGGGGFSWQILMGHRFGFCQMHLTDEGIDTGDIVRTREFIYPPSCRTPADRSNIYIEKNLSFVIDFIEEIRKGGIDVETVRQPEYLSTYWPRLNTPLNGWIDWSDTLDSIERFICAFDEPYEGAKTQLNGETVYLKCVTTDFSDGSFHNFQAGLIFRASENWICVAAGQGTLIVEKITNEKGENMIDKLRAGDRLTTSRALLDNALANRVAYTPKGLK